MIRSVEKQKISRRNPWGGGKIRGVLFAALIVSAVIFLLSSCPAAQAPAREYKVIIEVSGIAATADITYTDLATNPVTDIFSDAGQAVPYTKEVTGSVDYSDIQDRQVTVTADVAAGETLEVTVYYEEIMTFPPEGNRKTVADGAYQNTTGSPVAAYDLIVNFSFPPE